MPAIEVFYALKEILDLQQLRHAPDNTSHTLFEYMTKRTSPEIRAQEAIQAHLCEAGFQATREKSFSFGRNRRRFDLIVEGNAGPVIVELKHYSPHQTGQLAGLLGPVVTKAGAQLQSMHKDYHKHRPQDVPFIQLGLYTAIEGWHDAQKMQVPRKSSGCHFIEKFVPQPQPLESYEQAARQALGAWEYAHLFNCPNLPPTANDFCVGPGASYTSSTGVIVHGRVNYVLGIAN